MTVVSAVAGAATRSALGQATITALSGVSEAFYGFRGDLSTNGKEYDVKSPSGESLIRFPN